jgi:ATP-binding cassette subfamily B protein
VGSEAGEEITLTEGFYLKLLYVWYSNVLLFMNTKESTISHRPFKFLFSSSAPYWGVATLATLSVTIATTAGTVIPYAFKRIIDTISGVSGFGPESYWAWACIYIALGFIGAMGWRGSGFAGSRWATGATLTGRERLTAHVTKHSYGFFANRFAGAIGNKLNSSTDALSNLVDMMLWDWFPFILKLLISLGLIFYTNVYIAAVFVAWFVIMTPINISLMRKKVPLTVASQESQTELQAQTIDVLTNITAMHDYARRNFELKRLTGLIGARRQARLKNWLYSERVMVINNVMETLFMAGIIFATMYLWSLNLITAGDIILVLTLTISIRHDIASLGNRFNRFAEVVGQVKEGLDNILNEHEVTDTPHAQELEVSAGEIIFKDISFKYDAHEIFKNLNLRIHPGERVGLIGRSGAGKSTLMKLLMRQHDLSSGQILIDGQEISKVKQESLRDAIAVVPQDPVLFHRSLRENIRYGKITATDEDIIASAKQAQAHHFIDALPQKYETLVGERGIKLSGGERQRVAIARAFLKEAKILLLDEATSSLDSESEVMISKALEKLMENKTVIAIAHRLSTLRFMDRIVVLDNGQIVEDGSHEELLKQGGIYSELWAHQAGGFIKED